MGLENLMDSTYINIRFFSWHFQLSRDFNLGLSRNSHHKAAGWPDGYFSVYRLFWYAG